MPWLHGLKKTVDRETGFLKRRSRLRHRMRLSELDLGVHRSDFPIVHAQVGEAE